MSEEFEELPFEPFEEPNLSLVSNETSVPTRAINKPVASMLTLAEKLPINFAAFGALHALGESHGVVTAGFTAVTLVTELGGAIGSADLIESGTLSKTMVKVRQKIDKWKLGNEPSNLLTDSVVTVFLGTVGLNFFKQAQDAERTRAQNIKYSVLMGIGNTAVSATAAWLVPENVLNLKDFAQNAGEFSAALLVLGVARVAKSWLRRYRAPSVEAELSD